MNMCIGAKLPLNGNLAQVETMSLSKSISISVFRTEMPGIRGSGGSPNGHLSAGDTGNEFVTSLNGKNGYPSLRKAYYGR